MSIEAELKAIFYEEGREHMNSLEEDLLQLETASGTGGQVDMELVNRIFRSAHTIKGSAGSVGFTDLSGFTHTVENVLDKVRHNALGVTQELISILLNCVDCMSRMLEAAMNRGDHPSQEERAELVNQLGKFLSVGVEAAVQVAESTVQTAQKASAEKTEQSFALSLRFSRDMLESGTDPLMLFAELADLGTLRVDRAHPEAVPPLEAMNPFQLYLWWEVTLTGKVTREDIDAVFIFVSDDSQITITPVAKTDGESQAPEPARAAALAVPAADTKPAAGDPKTQGADKQKGGFSSVRVDTERLDRLVNLVGELVIGQARVAQLGLSEGATAEMTSAVEVLIRITRELQDEAMGMRMLPIGPTFVQFQRVVRDLALAQGKQVNLEISGQETELDKGIIEKIGDPLKHMVRNAVDHGLEPVEERRAAGKPEKGTMHLSAYHAEGNIVIEIADDGRGLDTEAIANKAVQQGLIPPDHNLSESQIHQLVFHPGLSTAKKITDVSGRGVGMDVVKRNIEQLRGRIDISSVLGKGTTFKISLPLTLAIIDGMAVAVGRETYLIPLLSIVESIRPRPQDIQNVSERGELITVRGEALPLIRLHRLLNIRTDRTDPSTDALVMIVESGRRRYCMLVDDVLGQQQVVIKSLETNYQKVEGIAGATILADGRVALILDIPALIRQAFAHVGAR